MKVLRETRLEEIKIENERRLKEIQIENERRLKKIEDTIKHLSNELDQAIDSGDYDKISKYATLLDQLKDLVQQNKLPEALVEIEKADLRYASCTPGNAI